MNILVTDGNSRAALAIVRSLGAKGHKVTVGSSSLTSLASSSKYCHTAVQYPDPVRNERAFVDSILQSIEKFSIDAIIPVTDVCVLLMSKNRDAIPDSCLLPLAPENSLLHAADKNRLLDTARHLGVATPRTVVVESQEDCIEWEFDKYYPVVIKPSRSRIQVGDGWLSTKVDYANNAEDLVRKLQALNPAAFPVLLQERVRGPGIGQFYCFDGTRPMAKFAHRRLREKPPSGGVSVLRESVAIHPLADKFSVALLKELSWKGVAMVEFKLDERDGIPKLMEINGRFWGSLQLAIDSGVDFPNILLNAFSDNAIVQTATYKLGIRSRWLWGDVDLLLMYLFKSKDTLHLPANSRSRLLSALKILTPWVPNQKLEVERSSDIRPWLHETLSRLKR